MLHDTRQFRGIDPVAFEPGGDRKQVRVAHRELLAHDPRALQKLLLDQLEAFRHGCGYLALHGLDRRGIIRPPGAAPAVRVRHMNCRAEIAVELLRLR